MDGWMILCTVRAIWWLKVVLNGAFEVVGCKIIISLLWPLCQSVNLFFLVKQLLKNPVKWFSIHRHFAVIIRHQVWPKGNSYVTDNISQVREMSFGAFVKKWCVKPNQTDPTKYSATELSPLAQTLVWISAVKSSLEFFIGWNRFIWKLYDVWWSTKIKQNAL